MSETGVTPSSARDDVPPWPTTLWVVRHGESAGNVARDEAEAKGALQIAIASRDVDVPLSSRGEGQARALGAYFGALPRSERPSVVVTSPYVRAQQTARLALESSGFALPHVLDERLREREFGCLDGFTRQGVESHYPEEARRLTRLGKFYHRPPGGESWCDVFLRVRSFLGTLHNEYPGARVLVVAHQVVIYGFRYLLERMTEETVLAADRKGDLAHCGITSYALEARPRPAQLYRLVELNRIDPLVNAGEAVTGGPDAAVAPK